MLHVYAYIRLQQYSRIPFLFPSFFFWRNEWDTAHLHLNTNDVNKIRMSFWGFRLDMSFLPFVLQPSKKSRSFLFLLILNRMNFDPNTLKQKKQKRSINTQFTSDQAKEKYKNWKEHNVLQVQRHERASMREREITHKMPNMQEIFHRLIPASHHPIILRKS